MNAKGPYRALDEEEVTELRSLHIEQRVSITILAERYGVSKRTVCRYLSDRTSPREHRIRAVVDRWANAYAMRLRPPERDSLVAMVVLGLDQADRWAERRLRGAP